MYEGTNMGRGQTFGIILIVWYTTGVTQITNPNVGPFFSRLGTDWGQMCLKVFPFQGIWSARNHPTQSSCRCGDRIWDRHQASELRVTGANPSPHWGTASAEVNLYFRNTVTHPTEPSTKRQVGGASTPWLHSTRANTWAYHMQGPAPSLYMY